MDQGKYKKYFSESEMKELEKFNNLYPNYSIRQLAKLIGRSKSGITHHFEINGGREGYTAEKAMLRRNESIEKMREIGLKVSIEHHPVTRMKDQIDALRMQLDIIVEEIRELKQQITKED